MTKEAYISLLSSRYDELEKLGLLDNFYDYEKGLDKIWQDMGRQYLEESLRGKFQSNDRRRKKKL